MVILKIIFMGTPDFAVPSLKMLIEEGYNIQAVVTQPDKPKGRGKKISAPPVKEFALSKGLTVLQPENLRTGEFARKLCEIAPDLAVVVAYGKILPEDVLNIPRHGCINVHGSLLPKYRGAAPIQWAIINGEKITGITTMFMDAGMDTGDMLLKREVAIDDEITYGQLHDKLSVIGAEVLKDTLAELQKGVLKRTPQPHENATYAPMINKNTGKIDWNKTAREVHNLVRGTNPWPGAFCYYKNEKMKVWKTKIIEESGIYGKAGTILDSGKEGLLVACGSGTLNILEIQFDSCRKMTVGEYLCGHSINRHEILV